MLDSSSTKERLSGDPTSSTISDGSCRFVRWTLNEDFKNQCVNTLGKKNWSIVPPGDGSMNSQRRGCVWLLNVVQYVTGFRHIHRKQTSYPFPWSQGFTLQIDGGFIYLVYLGGFSWSHSAPPWLLTICLNQDIQRSIGPRLSSTRLKFFGVNSDI